MTPGARAGDYPGGASADDGGDELAASLAMHDDLIARRGVELWVGAEPTFTRTDSLEPAWTSAACGDDKLARAHALACALAARLPGAAVSRVVGRQFPEEDEPRFAFGVRWRDGGEPGGPRCAVDAAPEPQPTDTGDDHWLTVTPDPGVVEVNMAPCPSAAGFADQARRIWHAARASGLSATRHRFNGDVADAGGGGQLSLGGARPEHSPFVRYPHVLPALIRYLNNHPSLSYWFANDCVGSASQGPRPDEGTRERFEELGVALGWLEELADRGALPPDQLWGALGSLLVDASGNSHRAEINVEKLWNPHIPRHGARHGRMGIIELRSIRMPERPAMLAALAALFRSVVARLVVSHYREPLIDWHDELHDRFALPAALARDLRIVLGDLDEHGLGVPAQLRAELAAWRSPGIACRLGDAVLTLRPALEFWPLVGDVASQERAGARIVDASTQRWELAIDGPGPDRVSVSCGGAAALAPRWAQLHALGDGVRAVGVRRRIYQPMVGFHPGLPAGDPLVVEWAWAGRAQRIELWSWRPGGGAYTGLPLDDADAIERRQERIEVTTRDGDVVAASRWREHRPFTIDLRSS
ncbi:MAG TPA: transglutaminase family protein [Kofleriaceae bacterium]|nr:transglutaminase family protein [Kofleriaceae bacterium]